MIVWVNGAFGVGKTATARNLCADGTRRMFDPEFVGYMLAAQLKDLEFDDFQDLAPWRSLVPLAAKQIHDYTGTDLVAVQSVLNESYWNELKAGLATSELPLIHVMLDCEEHELRRRIESEARRKLSHQRGRGPGRMGAHPRTTDAGSRTCISRSSDRRSR